jgi:hypothetical protein
LVAALALVAVALVAPPAAATFHEISIREVYVGSATQPDSEYVELQMWAPGQHLVGGHSITAYDATGALAGTTTFSGDVAAGANQSTVLALTPAAASEFGAGADVAMTPGQLSPAGGAVCWESIDCVSWGSFSGPLSSPAGSAAVPAGIPNGMALRRAIAAGCPTELEANDDRDNSAADFAAVFPAPGSTRSRPASEPAAQAAARRVSREAQVGKPAGERRKRLCDASRRARPPIAPPASASPRTSMARPFSASSTASRSGSAARHTSQSGYRLALTLSRSVPATTRASSIRAPRPTASK